MEYAISKQITTVVIEFSVTEADPLEERKYDMPGSGRRAPRYFDPREGHLKIINGERVSLSLHGPRILKGGKLSEYERLPSTWSKRSIGQAPEWVQRIWREAGA